MAVHSYSLSLVNSGEKAEGRAGFGSRVNLEHSQLYNNGYSIKKHWNTVNVQGNLPAEAIEKMIALSYELVVKSLPKAEREKL